MTSICTVLAVADIATARKFYEELFGLEVWQDYGINVSFTCGLALQQAFGWLVGGADCEAPEQYGDMF